jgi:hypothetical protein
MSASLHELTPQLARGARTRANDGPSGCDFPDRTEPQSSCTSRKLFQLTHKYPNQRKGCVPRQICLFAMHERVSKHETNTCQCCHQHPDDTKRSNFWSQPALHLLQQRPRRWMANHCWICWCAYVLSEVASKRLRPYAHLQTCRPCARKDHGGNQSARIGPGVCKGPKIWTASRCVALTQVPGPASQIHSFFFEVKQWDKPVAIFINIKRVHRFTWKVSNSQKENKTT